MTQTLTFDEAEAVDIGGIDDPLAALLGKPSRFHMTRSRVTQGPMRIDFCRIDSEGWLGVVIALGDWQTKAPKNAGPYTVHLDDGSGTSESFAIAMHPWRGRWRWQNKPWPFPLTEPEELYTAKLLPRFDGSLPQGTDWYYGPYQYEPLGLAGLTPYMPQSGGRGDIGIVTQSQGWYLCNDNNPPTAVADILAQGEAGATFPWHFYDPDTGSIIDPIIQYPRAGLYAYASPAISIAPPNSLADIMLHGPAGTVLSPGTDWNFVMSSDTPAMQMRVPSGLTIPAGGSISAEMEVVTGGNKEPLVPFIVVHWSDLTTPIPDVTATLVPDGMIYGSGLTIDTAHQPACSYLPFLLTGDPYFLETLQGQATFCILENPDAPPEGGVGLQPRATGWTARTLAAAARVSPADPPRWLQRREIWTTALDQWAVTFRAQTVDSPDQQLQQVNLLNSDTWNLQFSPFQQDIGLSGIAFLCLLHPAHTAWHDILHWMLLQQIARLNNMSGWPRTVPSCYTGNMRDVLGAPLLGDWGKMWDATVVTNQLPPPQPPDTLDPNNADYMGHMSCGMGIAWQAGFTECTDELTWLRANWGPQIVAHQSWMLSQYATAGPMG
jgi:hypothetical protein